VDSSREFRCRSAVRPYNFILKCPPTHFLRGIRPMLADHSTSGMCDDVASGMQGTFADLLERVRAGREEAWQALVLRYNRRMLHVIRCWAGPGGLDFLV
jgi:hypothetical protein